jgi:signal transduction histidine kinase
VTNALRHADARTLIVRGRFEPPHDQHARAVVLVVQDDGRGLPTSSGVTPPAGRGLKNMARRATSVGATLAFEPAEPGTRVVVRWPVHPAVATTATA